MASLIFSIYLMPDIIIVGRCYMAACGGFFWFGLLILLGVFLVDLVLFICLLGFFLGFVLVICDWMMLMLRGRFI